MSGVVRQGMHTDNTADVPTSNLTLFKRATVGSNGGGGSYERGTPVGLQTGRSGALDKKQLIWLEFAGDSGAMSGVVRQGMYDDNTANVPTSNLTV